MPRIFRVQANDPLISGLRGGAASAASAIQFRRQKLADERAQKALELRERALDAEIDQRNQALQMRQQQAAMEQQQQQLAAIAGQGDFQGMLSRVAPPGALGPGEEGPLPEDVERMNAQQAEFAGRLERDMQLLPGLSEPAQRRLLERRQTEEHSLALRQGFEAEAQELADAMEDGLFEAAPEVAQELAGILEQNVQGGGKPGKVSEVIRKHRKRSAEEQVVQQEWAEAHETAQAYLSAAKSPNQKRKLMLEVVQNQAPSVQKKRSPELFLNRLRSIALSDDSGPALRDEALRGTQFETPQEGQEAQIVQEDQNPPEGVSFTDRVLDRQDREARGVLDSRDFGDVPVVDRKRFEREVTELLAGKAKTDRPGAFGIDVPQPVVANRESLEALFREHQINPQSLPPELKRKIIRAAKFGEK